MLAQIPYLVNSGSWDIGQNVLDQSDHSIFKSNISLEQNNEKTWLFACWYKFIEIKTWMKSIGVGVGEKYWGRRKVLGSLMDVLTLVAELANCGCISRRN